MTMAIQLKPAPRNNMPIETYTEDKVAQNQVADRSKSFLISLSSGIEFGLELKETRGVSSFGRIIPIPGTARTIIGVTYFRGGIEAAVDLGALWNMASLNLTKRSRAVLVEAEGRRAVLIVDSLVDLIDCDPGDLDLEKTNWLLTGQIGEINKNERKIPLISAALLLQSIA